MALIFDIETIGANFDTLDEVTQNSLTRWIKREAGDNEKKYNASLKDLKEGLGFSPLTGEIVAIGIYDTVLDQGVVYYQDEKNINKEDINSENSKEDSEDNYWEKDKYIFKPRSEENMLKDFWKGVKYYQEFVSFNGRSFDVPFLMLRSVVNRIIPSKNLMTHRYLNYQPINIRHIDLLDQLSFYGAVRRRGNLHLYCNAFGIESPKASGVTGDEVNTLFKNKEYKKIAEYNSWDLEATRELYNLWKKYLKK